MKFQSVNPFLFQFIEFFFVQWFHNLLITLLNSKLIQYEIEPDPGVPNDILVQNIKELPLGCVL